MVEGRERSGQLTDASFGDMSFPPPDVAVSFVAPTATLEGRAVLEDFAESDGAAAAPFFGCFGSSFLPLPALVAAAAGAGAAGVLLQGEIQSTSSPARAAQGVECTTQSQRQVPLLVALQKQQQQVRRAATAAEHMTQSNGSAFTCQETHEHSHRSHFSWVSQAHGASHLLLYMFTSTRQIPSATTHRMFTIIQLLQTLCKSYSLRHTNKQTTWKGGGGGGGGGLIWLPISDNSHLKRRVGRAQGLKPAREPLGVTARPGREGVYRPLCALPVLPCVAKRLRSQGARLLASFGCLSSNAAC